MEEGGPATQCLPEAHSVSSKTLETCHSYCEQRLYFQLGIHREQARHSTLMEQLENQGTEDGQGSLAQTELAAPGIGPGAGVGVGVAGGGGVCWGGGRGL